MVHGGELDERKRFCDTTVPTHMMRKETVDDDERYVNVQRETRCGEGTLRKLGIG